MEQRQNFSHHAYGMISFKMPTQNQPNSFVKQFFVDLVRYCFFVNVNCVLKSCYKTNKVKDGTWTPFDETTNGQLCKFYVKICERIKKMEFSDYKMAINSTKCSH